MAAGNMQGLYMHPMMLECHWQCHHHHVMMQSTCTLCGLHRWHKKSGRYGRHRGNRQGLCTQHSACIGWNSKYISLAWKPQFYC